MSLLLTKCKVTIRLSLMSQQQLAFRLIYIKISNLCSLKELKEKVKVSRANDLHLN